MRSVCFNNPIQKVKNRKTFRFSKKFMTKKYFRDDVSFTKYNKLEKTIDESKINLLKGLKNTSVVSIKDSDVKYLKLDMKRYPSEDAEELGGVLWIREFYDRLFEQTRKFRRVVLVGNPRIGKSKVFLNFSNF
jgi:hypothetical protein